MALLTAFETIHLNKLITIRLCYFDANDWDADCARQYQQDIPLHLCSALPKRLAEFVAGRTLAHQLLAAQGCSSKLILPLNTQVPVWPQGYLGSITHINGVAGCAVLSECSYVGLGIDLEQWIVESNAKDIAPLICFAEELEVCTRLNWSQSQALTLIFSAKESLYKALYRKVLRYFDFLDADVVGCEGDQVSGQITLCLNKTLCTDYIKGQCFTVSYLARENWVLTGLAIIKHKDLE